eukprot:g2857.t1
MVHAMLALCEEMEKKTNDPIEKDTVNTMLQKFKAITKFEYPNKMVKMEIEKLLHTDENKKRRPVLLRLAECALGCYDTTLSNVRIGSNFLSTFDRLDAAVQDATKPATSDVIGAGATKTDENTTCGGIDTASQTTRRAACDFIRMTIETKPVCAPMKILNPKSTLWKEEEECKETWALRLHALYVRFQVGLVALVASPRAITPIGRIASLVVTGASVNGTKKTNWPKHEHLQTVWEKTYPNMIVVPALPHPTVLRRAMYGPGALTNPNLYKLRRSIDLRLVETTVKELKALQTDENAWQTPTANCIFAKLKCPEGPQCTFCKEKKETLFSVKDDTPDAIKRYDLAVRERVPEKVFCCQTKMHDQPKAPKKVYVKSVSTNRDDLVKDLNSLRRDVRSLRVHDKRKHKSGEGKEKKQPKWTDVTKYIHDENKKSLTKMAHTMTTRLKKVTLEGAAMYALLSRGAARAAYGNVTAFEQHAAEQGSDMTVFLLTFMHDPEITQKSNVTGVRDVVVMGTLTDDESHIDVKRIVGCVSDPTKVYVGLSKTQRLTDVNRKNLACRLKQESSCAVFEIGGKAPRVWTTRGVKKALADATTATAFDTDAATALADAQEVTGKLVKLTKPIRTTTKTNATYARATKNLHKIALTHAWVHSTEKNEPRNEAIFDAQFCLWRDAMSDRSVRETNFTKIASSTSDEGYVIIADARTELQAGDVGKAFNELLRDEAAAGTAKADAEETSHIYALRCAKDKFEYRKYTKRAWPTNPKKEEDGEDIVERMSKRMSKRIHDSNYFAVLGDPSNDDDDEGENDGEGGDDDEGGGRRLKCQCSPRGTKERNAVRDAK